MPHNSPADSIRTSPSSMTNTDGSSQAPTMANASAPLFLPARAKCDEDSASLNRPVSGDLAATQNLADVVNGVPTSGLKQKSRGAAGSSGSTPAGASRDRSHAASPAPPRKRRRTDRSE